jgi:hypothetical protein
MSTTKKNQTSQTRKQEPSRDVLNAEQARFAETPKESKATAPSKEPAHPRSHAIHLEAPGTAHTKPAGDLRHGVNPGARRQP